jgi:VWFA-related protein
VATQADRNLTEGARVSSLLLSGFLAWSGAFSPLAGSQESPPTFPAQVEQVTVDVVVIDRKGEPVTGLKKEDLEVYENGSPQTIVSFDAVEVAAAPAAKPAPLPRVSTNTSDDRRRPGRTFVIFFDDIHLTPFTAQRAKAAVADFLRTEAREGDRVTLVAAGGGAWWITRMAAGRDEMIDLVKRLQGRSFPDTSRDRMSDYEAMRIHVFRDEMVMNRVQRRFEAARLMTSTQQSQHVTGPRAVEDPLVTARAGEIYFGAAARNRITLEALERSLKALVDVQGRKSLILVSDGFIYDPQLDLFKKLVDASRRANTAIYFVNNRGLEALPVAMTAEFSAPLPPEDIGSAFAESFEATEGSESVAADSGGFTVRNTSDLTSGFRRIADETRVYYLIGYNPTNAARDGTFRKIQVKVRDGKGIQLRARKGYYAPSAPQTALSPKSGDPVFQHALDSPYEVDDIPLRMTHFVREETALLGRAHVIVAVDVDIRNLGFAEKEGQSTDTLELLLVAANRETGQFFRQDQKVDLKLLPATRERITRTWLPIVREFELGTGRYQAKIVVRDKATGRIGTVVHEFEVPDLGQFRVTTPVLSDVRDDTEDGSAGNQLAVLARRDFPQGASLFCQFEVYGATRLETSRMPRVSMGYQVRRSDGTLYTQDPASIINPTPIGSLSRMIGFSLEDAIPGDYEIVMRVKDELSGKSLELHEPFSVTSPLTSVPAAPSSK